MLLNLTIFMWYGAVCPWSSFLHNSVIPIYRLVPLGILILLFRRMPIVLAIHKHIVEIEQMRQALFVGFFGPMGVSAIFYLYVSLEYLDGIRVDGVVREDAAWLAEVMTVVVWFLAICSVVVHGLSVPLGKLGYHLPQTFSRARTMDREDEPELPFHVDGRLRAEGHELRNRVKAGPGRKSGERGAKRERNGEAFRLGEAATPEERVIGGSSGGEVTPVERTMGDTNGGFGGEESTVGETGIGSEGRA